MGQYSRRGTLVHSRAHERYRTVAIHHAGRARDDAPAPSSIRKTYDHDRQREGSAVTGGVEPDARGGRRRHPRVRRAMVARTGPGRQNPGPGHGPAPHRGRRARRRTAAAALQRRAPHGVSRRNRTERVEALPVAELERYYRADQAFYRLITCAVRTVQLKLDPGRC